MENEELKRGSVVISKRGHDKGDYLVVVGHEGNRILVADGDKRKVSRPKKKNPIHLRFFGEVIDVPCHESNPAVADATIRKTFKELKLRDENRQSTGG
jgi:ribosomal protein L14E/L6E/L27E